MLLREWAMRSGGGTIEDDYATRISGEPAELPRFGFRYSTERVSVRTWHLQNGNVSGAAQWVIDGVPRDM